MNADGMSSFSRAVRGQADGTWVAGCRGWSHCVRRALGGELEPRNRILRAPTVAGRVDADARLDEQEDLVVWLRELEHVPAQAESEAWRGIAWCRVGSGSYEEAPCVVAHVLGVMS